MAAARPSLKIELEGFDALQRTFNELPFKIQQKFLRPALRVGAKVLLRSVQRTSPRSDRAPHVGNTLKIKATKRRVGRVGYNIVTGTPAELGIREWTADEKAALEAHKAKKRGAKHRKGRGKLRVGPGYYPAHIEFGYTRKGKHIPANPWMRRGLDEGRADAIQATAEDMSRRMKESIGMGGKTDAEAFGGGV